MQNLKKRLYQHLTFIYKEKYSDRLLSEILQLIEKHKPFADAPTEKWNESDVVLITYGDSVINENENPIATLHRFLKNNLSDVLSTVHILPFFPIALMMDFRLLIIPKLTRSLATGIMWKTLQKIFH